MADVFNKTPTDFVDLNELFPVLNEAVGLTYEQFRILVENTFWLKNREEIGIVKAYIVSGSSEFGALWLSETNGGEPLIPDNRCIYIIQTTGQFKNKLFSWNGSVYEQLAKDSDNNYTNLDKSKVDKLIIDGNGTRFLANDGIYKTVSSGGIPDAPIDDKAYARKNSEWAETLTKEEIDNLVANIPTIPDAPSDGKQYSRKDGDWVKVSKLESADSNSYIEAGGDVNNIIDFFESPLSFKTILQQNNKSIVMHVNREHSTGENYYRIELNKDTGVFELKKLSVTVGVGGAYTTLETFDFFNNEIKYQYTTPFGQPGSYLRKYKFINSDTLIDDEQVVRKKDIEMAITGFLNNGEIEV